MEQNRNHRSWFITLATTCLAVSASATPVPIPYTELTTSNLPELGFELDINRGKTANLVLTVPPRFEGTFAPNAVRIETFDAKKTSLSISYVFFTSNSRKVVLLFTPKKSDVKLSILYTCVNQDKASTCSGSREVGINSVSSFLLNSGDFTHLGRNHND